MKTILYVEPGRSTRRYTTRVLEYEGYAVIGFSRVGPAKDMVENGQHYDLLLTDLCFGSEEGYVPILDGDDLIELSKEKHPRTPIIIFSAWNDELDRRANAFLRKPVLNEVVLSTIERVLTSSTS